MAFGLQHNKYGIEDVGVICQVPDNPFAKLAYYLGMVGTCLGIKGELGELADYSRFRWFTLDDKKKIVSLAYLLSPDELIGKCWFPSENLNCSNEIYELSQVQNNIIYSSVIRIGSRSRRVAKIMLFKRSWIENNYLRPLQSAVQIINYQGKKKTLFEYFSLLLIG